MTNKASGSHPSSSFTRMCKPTVLAILLLLYSSLSFLPSFLLSSLLLLSPGSSFSFIPLLLLPSSRLSLFLLPSHFTSFLLLTVYPFLYCNSSSFLLFLPPSYCSLVLLLLGLLSSFSFFLLPSHFYRSFLPSFLLILPSFSSFCLFWHPVLLNFYSILVIFLHPRRFLPSTFLPQSFCLLSLILILSSYLYTTSFLLSSSFLPFHSFFSSHFPSPRPFSSFLHVDVPSSSLPLPASSFLILPPHCFFFVLQHVIL